MSNRYDFSNGLMTRNYRAKFRSVSYMQEIYRTISSQRISKLPGLYNQIAVANASCKDLDQDLSFGGAYQLFILDGEGLVRVIEDSRFEGLWQSGSHIGDLCDPVDS